MPLPTSDLIAQLKEINLSIQSITTAIQDQPFWDTQLFAAVIGALFGLTPSLYLLWKDRPIIKVKAKHVLIPYNDFGGAMRHGVKIEIINTGRRKTTIQDVSIEFNDGETLFFPDNAFIGNRNLPKILEENSSHFVIIAAEELGLGLLKKQEYPVAVFYRSATGKIYKQKTSQKFWEKIYKKDESNTENEK